jgi:hypothetical protein
MKNFSLKTKENSLLSFKNQKLRRYLIAVVLAWLILLFGKDLAAAVGSSMAASFYDARHYFETSSETIPVFFRSRMELLSEINSLKQKISEENGQDAVLSYIMEENKELRALLQATSSPRVLAGVIARPPLTPYDTIIIDRGSHDGVVEHAPVYHGKNIAIGYVRKVFKEHALIALFSSPGVESTVYIFGPDFFTRAYGEGGGIIRLSIPQGMLVEAGNTVVLPSVDTGVLGIVDQVESTPTEPEQHAYVTLDVPIQSMRLVSVGARAIEKMPFEEALINVKEVESRFLIDVPEDERLQNASTSKPVGTTTLSV